MRMAIARAIMAVAVHCLGDTRRDWALAMQAEFEVAAEAGAPLTFALGCLSTAWREMPAHEEGRFTLASHMLAMGVVVPLAALLVSSVALGSPYLAPNEAGAGLLGSGRPTFPIIDANRPGLPLMAMLTFLLGLGHVYIAWAMLDRDWARVAIAGRMGAAVMVTMLAFTGLLFPDDSCALPQAMMLAIELAAIWLLVRWHADLADADPAAKPVEYAP